jgi:hypothetical protein
VDRRSTAHRVCPVRPSGILRVSLPGAKAEYLGLVRLC